MPTVSVSLASHSYPIHIGTGLLPSCLDEIKEGREIALITDANIEALPWYGVVVEELKTKAVKFVEIVLPAGEGTKNLQVFADVCSRLAAQAFSRKSVVVALGGGVIGDLAGYVAASYLRGVEFVQIPTTLLAMVDSSVGGKTGVNLPEGKNLVGAFYQPSAVYIDLDLLKSLPEREVAAGMAEVVKYGIIRDPELFRQVETGKGFALAAVVKRCVEIKAEVVGADERETTGLRAILNFGHTLGHAIEQSAGYGELLHGEAVAIGMCGAAFLSQQACGLGAGDVSRIRTAVEANKLPSSRAGLDFEKLKAAMGRDKKADAKGITWVLAPEIGKTELRRDISEELVRRAVAVCSGEV